MSGIKDHSRDFPWTPFVIFAIDAASNGRDAMQTVRGVVQFKLWCKSQGLGVKELLGSYNGVSEPSFIMSEDDFRRAAVGDTWCMEQESFLVHLSGKQEPHKPNAGFRMVQLYYPKTGELVPLGRWECISGDKARTLSAWTYDPSDGLFWAASETTLLSPLAQAA